MKTHRLAGWMLAAALAAAVPADWGCDKYRRACVWTPGAAVASAEALPPVLLPPPAAAFEPQAPPACEPAPALLEPPAPPGPPAPAVPAAPSQSWQAQESPPPAVEVLARGPMHEAFAEPVVANPSPGIIVYRAPPGLVQEVPPAERPLGAIWIPGYWAWDDDRGDFLWVSGIWRISPPGCRWVPGYWAPVPGAWQWVPGFWLPQAAGQVEYLPTPPQSLEAGPVGLALSLDDMWVPGCWYRQGYQYAWRAGFWAPARPDWVWVPAHYIWTPRGCIFVAGYWDYVVGARGILFAPVRFVQPLYAQPAYVFLPTVVIETRFLTIALFSRPRYSHYYFGDYFEADYARRGIMPWYECRTRHDWYDPIFFHAAWQNRQDRRWEERQREHYEHLRLDRAARPPQTFAAQVQLARSAEPAAGAAAESRPVVLAAPLSEVAARTPPAMRLERLDGASRSALEQYAGRLRTYRDERTAVEAGAAAPRPRTDAPGATLRPPAVRGPGGPAAQATPAAATPPETRQPARPVAPSEVFRSPAVRPPQSVPPTEVRRPEPVPPPETRQPARPVAPSEVLRPPSVPAPAVPPPVVRQPQSVPPTEVRRPEPVPH
ncbi:MAG: hypothetical protein FJ288_11505, partial [Planctomycetes bacterium]|nr:hypothetical protein [Planctomycetota bacterium]